MSRSTARIRVLRWVLACVTLVLMVGAAELALRITIRFGGEAHRGNILPIYAPTTDARPFGLRPNFEHEVRTPEFRMHIRTNDFGLRENTSMQSILDHDFKIMAMGDSHTFGYGVNHGERYSDLLNRILTPRAISFSTGYAAGFSPVDYEAFLRAYDDRFAPDIVVIGFYPENDVVNDVVQRTILRNADGEIVATRLRGLRVVDGFITGEGSAFSAATVEAKIYLWNTFALYRRAVEARNRIRDWFQPERQDTNFPTFFFGEVSHQEEIDVTLTAIKAMNRFLKARGKTLLVLFIPSSFQISPYYERPMTLRPGYRMTSERMDLARKLLEPQGMFGKLLHAEGIRFVDPTREFIAADRDGSRLYYRSDGHLTVQGHALTARLISDYLVGNRLIPCPYVSASAVPTVARSECPP